ncbi:MAG TPA: carboxypeptidase regulatory-like domain-containing protein, partial [Longimicrobium sp.]|nr:carboxypeptidase regulatory-like domain-containing protein [Longimicrobium sp.]
MLAPLAALLLAAAAPDTTWGAIRGTVASDPGGLPLASAVVEVLSGGRALTDSAGGYRLTRVPAGPQTVRVHSIDHEALEVEVLVPARGEIELDVSLRHRPLMLDPVNGVSSGQGGTASDAAPRGVAAITDFPALEGPGTGMEGGAGGGSGGDVLLVRGSAADLKLVLLDGAPVYAPFHMGGLIDSFEPGLLSGARLYLGGAPARYDGGVSYVLDLATRRAGADRWSGGAGADMMAVRAEADGPLWRGAGLLVAGRAVHGASLGRLEGEPFPYRYADGLARLDVALGARSSLAFTGFLNGEGVRVDTVSGRDDFLRWSNGAGSLRLRFPVAGSRAEVTAALSEFDAWLPNPADEWQVQARLRRARLAVDMTQDLGSLRLGYGYQYDRQWARHKGLDRRVGERLWFMRDTVGSVGGWYVDGLYRPKGDWVVRGGLRGDMYAGGPFLSFSPRLAVTWLLSGRATLTLA